MNRCSRGLAMLAASALAVGWIVRLGGWPPDGVRAASAEALGSDAQASASVRIQTFQFEPNPLEVKAGTRVTWTNQDDITHTITSGAPEDRDGRFDSRLEGKGAAFSFTFTQPGAYTYFCNRHQAMRGEIRVE